MVSRPRNAGIYGQVGGRPDVSHLPSTMERRAVFLALFVTTLFGLVAVSFGDDVKHKKVIIKVPKKIKHIHHHHVKKVHIWKHKPKPIHSIHVVEEEEPIGKHWKGLLDGHKSPFSHWKHEKPIHEEEEEEYEEEGDEEHLEEHKKSGSNHSPVVWKGKVRGESTRKQRMYGNEKRKNVRGVTKSSKGDRRKRQKHVPRIPVYDDKFYDEPRYHTKPKANKPTSSKGKYKNTEKMPKRKPYSAREAEIPDFKDYEYSEYEDYGRGRAVWPERKEHISWHIRDDEGDSTKSSESGEPNYISDYQSEHRGEINLAKEPLPDIPVVPPPVLAPAHEAKFTQAIPLKPIFLSQFNLEPENPYPDLLSADFLKSQKNLKEEKPRYPYSTATDLQEHPENWKHENPHYSARVSTGTLKPLKKTKDSVKSPLASSGFKTHEEQGVFSGYSSHVGHNPEGGAASFQSVTFGKKALH